MAAAHPAVTEDTTQAQFRLIGLRADPPSLSVRVIPGSPLTGTMSIDNLGSIPLSGLSVSVTGAPANVVINTSLTATNLSGKGSVTLGYTITAADASTLMGHLNLHITSTEGAIVDVPVDVQVVPLTPQLTSDPGSILQGVVIGQQKVVSFDATNIGGAASGPLQILLPDGIPWLTLASDATIPSLDPGAKTTVTLVLTSPADTPLALNQGTISLVGANSHLDIGYQIRTVSSAVDDLQVSVEDEYTYFATSASRVCGATVLLRDPYDNTVVMAQGTTDSRGQVVLPNVAEGNYLLEIQADKHSTYQGYVSVTSGTTNDATIFLHRQMISYSFVVAPSSIPDRYTINMTSQFETGVPAPIVTIDIPEYVPNPAPGEKVEFDAVVTNYGLIAANNTKLILPTIPGYSINAVTTELGAIPAMSSITVPITIENASEGTLSAQAGGGGGVICEFLDVLTLSTYKCGPSVVLVWGED